jgi:Ca-activated chloride channel family protein
MNRRGFLLVAIVLFCSLVIVACGLSGMPTGPLGATVGGAKDIGYARQIINSGGVPEPAWIVAEGLYSEHDILTPVGDCADRLCLAFGYGYAPAIDSNREALFVHLGMTSTITKETFKRPHLQLALVIDRSGSMTGEKFDGVKESLRRLVRKLDEQDEVVLVQFDDGAQKVFGPKRITSQQELLGAINGLEIGGGTNIEAGMNIGYSELEQLPVRSGTEKRLMLFTDAQPNVGATGPGAFGGMTQHYADMGIGLSAFGIGIDFGQDLIYHITKLRGGNFFFLGSKEAIRSIFDTEFDYLVTPLAYDLKLHVATPAGMKLVAVYGLPTWQPGSKDADLEIPTVFLSSKHGAIVLRYERETGAELRIEQGNTLADGSLNYTNLDQTPHTHHVLLQHSAPSPLAPGVRYFTHNGTRLAVALTNVYLGLRLGSQFHHEGKKQEALDIIERAIAEARAENTVLNDSGLAMEIDLLKKLRVNCE